MSIEKSQYPYGRQGIYNIVNNSKPMIQTKPVTCKHCQAVNMHHSFQCSKIRKPIANRSEKKIAEEQAVGFKQAPRSAIKQVADKRKKELQQYSKLSGPFKKENPYCHAHLVGCTVRTTDIHHMKGRENQLLLKVEYFLPVCRNCHDIIGAKPTMAKELGLSINRTLA